MTGMIWNYRLLTNVVIIGENHISEVEGGPELSAEVQLVHTHTGKSHRGRLLSSSER